ncbi:MAG: transposase [Desulfobacterales bacterium]|nr:transposase [Desulfobacterales bacterium]
MVPLPDFTYHALRTLWRKHRNPNFLFPNAKSPNALHSAITHMNVGSVQQAMELSSIVDQYKYLYMSKYKNRVLPGHKKALRSILSCRTPDAGLLYVRCSECNHRDVQPVSCGHRNCPKCQNHETSRWIDRQINKLLPVPYFMVTFTLPFELRSLAYSNQRKIYSIMFKSISNTLRDFGLNRKNLGADIAMSMVLHTHNRSLDYHPHMHVIVPGGGVDKGRKQWKKKKSKYLFNQDALSKVFRARFLSALNNSKLPVPKRIPFKWVVDCSYAGGGLTAFKYLSRYLYRGVISEKNIIANKNGVVTFRYIESKTNKTRCRTLKSEDFLHLIMQHVLPKGFRRIRGYGFLHGNAKKLLFIVQLILHKL